MNNDFPYATISVKAQKGYVYNFSHEVDDLTKEAIRTGWSPQGTDWGSFIGINIIRIISLPHKKKGWIEINVTPEKDEYKRTGLLWSKVTIVPDDLIMQIVEDYFSNLPASIRSRSKRYVPNKLWLSWRVFWGASVIFTSIDFFQDYELIKATIIRSYLILPKILQQNTTISTFALSDKKTDDFTCIPSEYIQHKKASVIIDTKTG